MHGGGSGFCSTVGLCMVVAGHVEEGCWEAGLQRLEGLWGPGPKGEGIPRWTTWEKNRVGLEMWLRGEYLPGMHHILAPIPNTGRK